MPWDKAIVLIAIEAVLGFLSCVELIPWFRKLRTGKFDIHIGDRFSKDGSEPAFGGVVIAIPVLIGTLLYSAFFNNENALGNDNSIKLVMTTVIFSMLVMALGLVEDWLIDVKKQILRLRIVTKFFVEFMLSLCFLASLRLFCTEAKTAIYMPFVWKYVDLGVLYYPVVAVCMTVVINAVKLHDCFGNGTSNNVDGLCAVTAMLYMMIVTVCGNVVGDDRISAMGYIFSSAIIGYLMWGLSPSKIYLGNSGALLLGGLISAVSVASGLHMIVFMAGISFFVDDLCTLVQYAVFKKSKKLVLKGASLHEHLKVKGLSDYKIIVLFSLVTLIGGAMATAFCVYR